MRKQFLQHFVGRRMLAKCILLNFCKILLALYSIKFILFQMCHALRLR